MNTTTPRQYRLLRDLPDAKAGTILTFDGDNCYDYNSNRTGQGEDLVTVCWYKKDFVENNLDWFELVTPVVENEKKYLLSVDDICSIYDVWSLERKQSFRSALNEYVKQIPTKSPPPTTSSIEEEKPVLFTTYDNKKCYDGDTVWGVAIQGTSYDQIKSKTLPFDKYRMHSNRIWFSSEFAAQNYVLTHKPVLSVNEVSEWLRKSTSFVSADYTSLKELAKNKIK